MIYPRQTLWYIACRVAPVPESFLAAIRSLLRCHSPEVFPPGQRSCKRVLRWVLFMYSWHTEHTGCYLGMGKISWKYRGDGNDVLR